MRQRLFPRPFLALTVFLLWVVITNAASLGLIVLGGLLAVTVPQLTVAFWPAPPRFILSWRVLRFLAVFLGDIISANWRVARQVIGPACRLSPAFVEVPLDLRDPFVVTLLASVVSLTPGTVSIDVDQQRWVLRIHALDAPDPQALVHEIKERYERPLREIFPC